MRDLLTHRLCHEIRLAPLRETDVAEYLNAQSSVGPAPPGISSLLHRRSEGNPLRMVAALERMNKHNLLTLAHGRWQLHVSLDEIDSAVPHDLRLMVTAQLERLSTPQRAVLELASATFSAAILGYALGEDPRVLANLLEELARLYDVVR